MVVVVEVVVVGWVRELVTPLSRGEFCHFSLQLAQGSSKAFFVCHLGLLKNVEFGQLLRARTNAK